jgi:hypothetical protein
LAVAGAGADGPASLVEVVSVVVVLPLTSSMRAFASSGVSRPAATSSRIARIVSPADPAAPAAPSVGDVVLSADDVAPAVSDREFSAVWDVPVSDLVVSDVVVSDGVASLGPLAAGSPESADTAPFAPDAREGLSLGGAPSLGEPTGSVASSHGSGDVCSDMGSSPGLCGGGS